MVIVGLMGGASYVNVFYLLLKDPAIAEEKRELAVNITSIIYSLGVLLASVTVIVLDETIYSGV